MKKSQKLIKQSKILNFKIDQSGHVEYTSHDTVIAFSNSKKGAILIKAKEKRLLQKHFREAGKSRIFVMRLFSLLIFLLLEKESFQDIIIDIEYPGKGDLIKNYILQDFKKSGRQIDPDSIKFRLIGKSCEAHWHGYYVFKGKRKPDKIITAGQVLKKIEYFLVT